MKVTKGKSEYACIFLRPGYFETGVLSDYLTTDGSDDRNLPAYFLTDNCDVDAISHSLEIVLPRLRDAAEHTVYIPLDSVLLVTIQKTAPKKEEFGRVGFKSPGVTDNATAGTEVQ
jgi:hypothetical protein